MPRISAVLLILSVSCFFQSYFYKNRGDFRVVVSYNLYYFHQSAYPLSRLFFRKFLSSRVNDYQFFHLPVCRPRILHNRLLRMILPNHLSCRLQTLYYFFFQLQHLPRLELTGVQEVTLDHLLFSYGYDFGVLLGD